MRTKTQKLITFCVLLGYLFLGAVQGEGFVICVGADDQLITVISTACPLDISHTSADTKHSVNDHESNEESCPGNHHSKCMDISLSNPPPHFQSRQHPRPPAPTLIPMIFANLQFDSREISRGFKPSLVAHHQTTSQVESIRLLI